MPTPERLSSKSFALRFGGLALVLLAAFGPAALVHAPLLRGELPLFRDVRHFYQPMELRQQQAWREGRVPLWNDVEGIGFPEFAEPTAATFYPGKVAFALPAPWGVRWFVYFVGHAGIACFGARRFARACGLSSTASLVAGAAYAASGELLFQSCNPVYLVGAAWLPWALGEALAVRRTGTLRHVVGLAASAALAVLGGDPQTVYHVGLLVGGAFAVEIAFAGAKTLARTIHRRSDGRGTSSGAAWRDRAVFAVQAALAGALAVGLASVQLVPSLEWFRQSARAASASDETSSPELNRFDFSVGPWRWSELLVPEALGSPFPIPRRWSYAFFPESRIWTPSYYFGAVPILLLPAALAVAKTRRRMLLPLALAIVGLAMASGRYGLGFFVEQVAAYGGVELGLPIDWGSPYALAVETLPLYEMFRYPAKWMPAVTLGLCVAGAAGIDALRTARGRRFLRITAAAGLLVAVLAAIGVWLPVVHAKWQALSIRGDSTFGPWDAAGSLADLRFALLYASIIVLLVLLFAIGIRSPRTGGAASFGLVGLTCLAILDPAWANRDLVATGRYDLEPASTIEWASLGVETEGPAAVRYLRGSIDGLPDREWQASSSPDRLLELALWERDSYRPRLGPQFGGPPALRSSASLEPTDLAPYLSGWRDARLTKSDPSADATIRDLEALSVGVLILPVGVAPVRGEFVRRQTLGGWDAQVDFWRLPNAMPRWTYSTRPDLVRRAEQALVANATLVLTEEDREALASSTLGDSNDESGVSIVEATPEFVRLSAGAAAPMLLVWNDRFDPGWQASRRDLGKSGWSDELSIGRVAPNGRFVVLPAVGSDQVAFRYSPRSLRIGASITLASLALASLLASLPRIRRRRATGR